MMTHFNELDLILNKYLKWNKSHVKCFTLIMLALIVKQTCNLSSASKALPITCLPQSFYRRMQRFFAGQYFDYRQISQLIFNMFSFDKVQLTLDRTNWKWGKRNINILMLAIVYRGIAIPILWTLLNGVVSGNGKYSTLRFFNCAQWPKFSTTYLGFASP